MNSATSRFNCWQAYLTNLMFFHCRRNRRFSRRWFLRDQLQKSPFGPRYMVNFFLGSFNQMTFGRAKVILTVPKNSDPYQEWNWNIRNIYYHINGMSDFNVISLVLRDNPGEPKTSIHTTCLETLIAMVERMSFHDNKKCMVHQCEDHPAFLKALLVERTTYIPTKKPPSWMHQILLNMVNFLWIWFPKKTGIN